jgi:hypothetical protein
VTALTANLVLLLTASAYGGWNPPKNPSPEKILTEAQNDAAARRYADALAKHVWFHENALKFEPGMSGVRLSFALAYWANLADVYPPALTKLKAVRDEAGKAVREARDPWNAFNDFAAINRVLKEQGRTKDLFLWLDANKPAEAGRVFVVAEPALVEAKEYRLCGKYLDPDRSFKQMVDIYREMTKIHPGLEEQAVELQEHAAKSFSNEAATLVALLAQNGLTADANRISAEAIKVWDSPAFRAQLEKARNGEVPPPWP